MPNEMRPKIWKMFLNSEAPRQQQHGSFSYKVCVIQPCMWYLIHKCVPHTHAYNYTIPCMHARTHTHTHSHTHTLNCAVWVLLPIAPHTTEQCIVGHNIAGGSWHKGGRKLYQPERTEQIYLYVIKDFAVAHVTVVM